MNQHLSLRSGNPALTASTFTRLGQAAYSESMTIQGTVNKTAVSLLIVMISASWTWGMPAGDPRAGGLMGLGVIGGLITAIVTIFKKEWAMYTVPLYAVLEGLALGGISRLFEAMFPGIVNQAVFLTFGTLGALLLAYKSGLIKATENFKLGVLPLRAVSLCFTSSVL